MAENVKKRKVIESPGKKRGWAVFSAILVVAVLAFSISPIIGCINERRDEAADSRVVATVNGIDITVGDVSASVFQARQEMAMEYPEFFSMFDGTANDYDEEFAPGVTVAQALRERAARAAAFNILIAQEAERLEIALTADDFENINRMVESDRAVLDGQQQNGFNIALAEVGFRGARDLARMLRNQMLMSEVIEAIVDNPAEFARFEAYMEDAEENDSDLLGAQHILSGLGSHPDGRPIMRNEADAEAIAAARSRADGIMARINAGEDFETLMFEYSTDPGLAGNPQGYTFGPNQMVPEFEQGTRALAIGQISGVISAPHGYHIIRRVEPQADPQEEIQRMSMAVLDGFIAMVDDAEIVFLPALADIWLGTAYDERNNSDDNDEE